MEWIPATCSPLPAFAGTSFAGTSFAGTSFAGMTNRGNRLEVGSEKVEG